MSLTHWMDANLRAQGYRLDEEEATQQAIGLRFSTAVCLGLEHRSAQLGSRARRADDVERVVDARHVVLPADGVDALREPEARDHFTLGYHDHVRALDDDYAMFAKNDGSNVLLYDLGTDPEMNTDIAGSNQDVIDRMWNDYVLQDAGGPLPDYDG